MLNEFDSEKSDRKFLQGRVYENIERLTNLTKWVPFGVMGGYVSRYYLCLDKCSRKEQATDRTVKN